MHNLARSLIAAVAVLVATLPAAAQNVSHAFTYQGVLTDNGQPANGTYDMLFQLFELSPPPIATIEVLNITVTDGLFTASLDFGPGAFDGGARNMLIDVRPSGGSYTQLGWINLPVAPMAEWARTSNTTLQQATDNGPNTINTGSSGLTIIPIDDEVTDPTLIVMGENSIEAAGKITAGDTIASTGVILSTSHLLAPNVHVLDGRLGFFSADGLTQYSSLEASSPSTIGLTFAAIANPSVVFSPGGIELFNAFGSRAISLIGGNIDCGNLQVSGVKNFVIDHPEDPTKNIVYASVEGPEAGAYCRGTAKLVDGVATISFDNHFSLVANPDTMTIQLTPRSADSMGLAVVEQTDAGFTVRELAKGTGTYEFNWHATAVRNGYENYQPVREKAEH